MKYHCAFIIFSILAALICVNSAIAADIPHEALLTEQTFTFDGKSYVITDSPSLDFVYLRETNFTLFDQILWTINSNIGMA